VTTVNTVTEEQKPPHHSSLTRHSSHSSLTRHSSPNNFHNEEKTMDTTSITSLTELAKESLTAYQTVAARDYGVTNVKQAFPIASRPDIAFRPKCDQLTEVWTAEGQTVFLFQNEEVYRLEGSHKASSSESVLTLSSAGVCVTGGDTTLAPLTRTVDVLNKVNATSSTPITVTTVQEPSEPLTANVESASSNSFSGLLLIAGLAILGTTGYLFFKKTGTKRTQSTPSVTTKVDTNEEGGDIELNL